MESNCEIFREMDKSFINKLNLELKLSYLLTDIIYPIGGIKVTRGGKGKFPPKHIIKSSLYKAIRTMECN